MRWAVLDEIIARATADPVDLLTARGEWEQATGRVHPEHELYAERSDAFVEWYVLERRSPVDGLTAVERCAVADEAERPTCLALRAAHRSLFRIVEVPGGHEIVVEDLIGGAQFRIEAERLRFVQPGDLFEARLVPDPEAPPRLLLGRAVIFHPRDALSAVREHVLRSQRRGEARSVLLARLLRLRLRALAYKHVPPQRIYGQKDALV